MAHFIRGCMCSYTAQVGSFCAPPPPTFSCAGALAHTAVHADSIAFAAAPIEYSAAYNSLSSTVAVLQLSEYSSML